VPDLPLCLGVLKHRAPLARREGHLPAKNFVLYNGALLMWYNFKFEGVLFRSDSRHNDSLWECATKQAVMTVAQWHRNQIIRGTLVIGKKLFKMDSCLRCAIFNLTAFCSIWTLIEECNSIDTGAVKNQHCCLKLRSGGGVGCRVGAC
jgi:hypothetical protein